MGNYTCYADGYDKLYQTHILQVTGKEKCSNYHVIRNLNFVKQISWFFPTFFVLCYILIEKGI